MDATQVGSTLYKTFFSEYSIQDLWKTCPCQMLWEAIRKESALIISMDDVKKKLQNVKSVYILPEPLPAMYMGMEPNYRLVSCEEILNDDAKNGKCHYWQIEPIYIINTDYSWMIVLTTENTPSGEQMIALVNRTGDGDVF